MTSISMRTYGEAPEEVGTYDVDFTQLCHYLYLPIFMSDLADDIRLPRRLEPFREIVDAAIDDFCEQTRPGNRGRYIYLTVHRGYATPGYPLNRPGWHADGFGTDDINYIWCDAFPTRFALHDFGPISDDHAVSLAQFADRARATHVYPPKTLLKLDPFVIHDVPDIPAPGGMRTFAKVSFSDQRYNLVGNSHNYDFDYDWPMHERSVVRNDPAFAGADFGPQQNQD